MYFGLNLPISNSRFAQLLTGIHQLECASGYSVSRYHNSSATPNIIIKVNHRFLILQCQLMSSSLNIQQSLQRDILGRVSSNIGLTPSSLLSHAYPTDICGVSLVISHNFTHSSLFSTFYQCLNLFLNQA